MNKINLEPTIKIKSRGRGRPSSRKTETMRASAEPSLCWFTLHKPKELDPCDCPYAECEGCWYPCEKCGSCKCSPFCRLIRKSMEMKQAPIEWKPSL